MSAPLLLVSGATGTTGRAATHHLLARGARVRVMVRKPEQLAQFPAPAQAVLADMTQAHTLAAALEGVDTLLLISPLDPALPQLQAPLAQAARVAGVRRIVKVSTEVAGPDAPDAIGRWHHEAELAVQATGLTWFHVRPCNFMQNMAAFAAGIGREGRFWAPLGEARISLVDARDVGAVAAEVMLQPQAQGGHVVVTGDDRPTYPEFAALVSQAIGRPVQYEDVAPEQALARFLAGGMPDWKAQALASMYRFLQDPATTQLTDAVRTWTGRAPRSLADFVREHAAGFAAGTLRH